MFFEIDNFKSPRSTIYSRDWGAQPRNKLSVKSLLVNQQLIIQHLGRWSWIIDKRRNGALIVPTILACSTELFLSPSGKILKNKNFNLFFILLLYKYLSCVVSSSETELRREQHERSRLIFCEFITGSNNIFSPNLPSNFIFHYLNCWCELLDFEKFHSWVPHSTAHTTSRTPRATHRMPHTTCHAPYAAHHAPGTTQTEI